MATLEWIEQIDEEDGISWKEAIECYHPNPKEVFERINIIDEKQQVIEYDGVIYKLRKLDDLIAFLRKVLPDNYALDVEYKVHEHCLGSKIVVIKKIV